MWLKSAADLIFINFKPVIPLIMIVRTAFKLKQYCFCSEINLVYYSI